MADTIYAPDPWTALSQQHSDIRREGVEHTSNVRRDIAAESGAIREHVATKTDIINSDIKSTAWTVSDRVQDEADRLANTATNFFIAQQQANAAQSLELAKLAIAVDKNAEISALATQRYISEDGERTRALINDLKNSDLNRMLVERNSDVNYYRSEAGRWEGVYGNGQFAALASQINALNSNLSETRQGLYNFGTMAGVGQSSTQNQVR